MSKVMLLNLLGHFIAIILLSCEPNLTTKKIVTHKPSIQDSDKIKIRKKVFDGKFISLEEWITLDSMKNIQSINYAKLDLQFMDSIDSIEYDCRVFSTFNYVHSYMILFDEDSIYQVIDMSGYSGGQGSFYRRAGLDEFAIRIVSTRMDLDKNSVTSNSINKQFKVIHNNEIIEQKYHFYNNGVSSRISEVSSDIFKRFK